MYKFVALVLMAGTLAAPSGTGIVRDGYGVPHIRATNAHDLFYRQGWAHAEDRLFQMDVTRRRASGTLAELLGPSELASDMRMRALGLRRAAEQTPARLSPSTIKDLDAYAEGVNARIASGPLPGQYAAAHVSKVEPWTVVDSLVVNKALAFSLSFDLDIDRSTAVAAYNERGFNGHDAVFFDLMPFAPFREASPVASSRTAAVPPAAARLAAGYEKEAAATPMIAEAMNRSGDRGSNSWVIGGKHTRTGRPILASDPHLGLEAPALFHPISLRGAGFDLQGDSLPGTPYIVLGQNKRIAWGATQHFMDVSDTYVEQVRTDPASPSGLSTVFRGRLEPVVAIEETFEVNGGDPVHGRTLIVPRRNNGPLLSHDLSTGAGLSVQYTGFSPTTELETFRRFALAENVDDFREAIQFFDVGGQHFTYADVGGTIAYFTNAEVPVREDLQAGAVRGNPPYLLRDGTGGNEWLPVAHPQPHQSVPYEIVPFAELPKAVNPPAGFIVSANNDSTGNTFDNDMLNARRPGGGIAYVSFFHNGFRAARITDLVRAAIARGPVGRADVVAMQADTTAIDAQFFTRLIVDALRHQPRQDPRVVAAVGRLARWDHTYPTGIPEGYDAADRDGRPSPPTQPEIDNSVAATIYALWRGRFVVNVFDRHVPAGLPSTTDFHAMQALRRLVETGGVGRSGIDFFAVPGIARSADRRDHLILKSLAEALDLAASDAFAPAFGNSADQGDYRWGKLHRITLTSPLGAPYTIPSPGNRFASPLPGLPGIPMDGGVNVPDVSGHPLRADTPGKFTVSLIPIRRFVTEGTPGGWRAVDSLAGGASEHLGDRYEQNLLRLWLTNDTYPVKGGI